MVDNNKPARGPLHASRLIQLLQALQLSAKPVSAHNVAEKLSGLIDLSQSVSLSETLRGLTRIKGGTAAQISVELNQHLLAERQQWRSLLLANCQIDGPVQVHALPRLTTDSSCAPTEAAQPFIRFYALQQSEMEYWIRGCQREVRARLLDARPDLAQLATLDESMSLILEQQVRRAFAVIPSMIGQHFQGCAAASVADLPWFDAFVHDLRHILLAELDIRLQPVIGLIEASAATPLTPTQDCPA